MAAAKKNSDKQDPDRLTAEFTSGQLVIAICVTLLFTLSVFLLGVCVGKYQKYGTLQTKEIARQQQAENPPEVPSPTAPAQKTASTGIQTTPRNPIEERSAPRPARSVINPYSSPTPHAPQPRTVELPPLPGLSPQTDPPHHISKAQSPEKANPPQTSPTKTQPETTEALATRKDEPQPEKLAAEPAAPTPPPAPVQQPIEKLEKPSPKPRPEPPKSPAPTPAPAPQAGFGIQLASFSGSDRKERAQEYLTRLKNNADITAQLIPTTDDVSYRVVLLGFSDKAAADKACAALKKKAGFADAWVRSFP